MKDKALILVDYINDIVHPDGKISGCATMIKECGIIDKCNKTLSFARENGWLVIWIKVGFEAGYPEVHPNSPFFTLAKQHQALKKGSWGTELFEDLDFKDNEIIIFKNRINPFHATNLEMILQAKNIDHIYLAGVSTEWAIEAAARDGHDRNFLITILEDLCASGSIDNHNHTIQVMQRIATIMQSNDLFA